VLATGLLKCFYFVQNFYDNANNSFYSGHDKYILEFLSLNEIRVLQLYLGGMKDTNLVFKASSTTICNEIDY